MQRMTWNEIKTKYPNQWVSLGDVDQEDNGDIKAGVVIAVGPDIKSVAQQSKGAKFNSHQFEYTGQVKNFLGFAQWNITNA
jgi:hypothetical protein